MDTTCTSAQHYIECDKCGENPAQFLTYSKGNLCEKCKIEIDLKKARKPKIQRRKRSEEGLDINCTHHHTRRLESFCCLCKTPVCTDCVITLHAGHSVQSLTAAYKEIQEDLQRKKDRIEKTLLPQYNELLNKEVQKRFVISERFDEIENQLEIHTQNVIEKVKAISNNTVQEIKLAKEDIFREIDSSKDQIARTLQRLEETNKMLSECINKPHNLPFLQQRNGCLQEDFKSFCKTFYIEVDCKIQNFQPGPVCYFIEENFGSLPKIKITEEVRHFEA